MKSEIIIKNEKVVIRLTPENDLEKDLIESATDNKREFDTVALFDCNRNFGVASNQIIEIHLTPKINP